MSEYTPLIAVDNVAAGKSVMVPVGNRYFIVSKDGDCYHVTDCVCPHAGGPLGGADIRDGCIICPVHHWPWDLKTGLTDPRFPEMRLRVYPCEVRGGIVHADISAEPPPGECDLDARHE
jgi:nitrite reductase/ring-hydroxylating ferredoxin subunit